MYMYTVDLCTLSQSISGLCLGRVCMYCTGFQISDVASSIVAFVLSMLLRLITCWDTEVVGDCSTGVTPRINSSRAANKNKPGLI